MPAQKEIDITEIAEKSLLEVLGLQDLPQEKRSPIIANMVKIIQTRVTARIFDELDDNGLKQFSDSDTNPKKTRAFLESKGIDLDKITSDEVVNFKAELLSLLGYNVK
ncbi:MAG: hypothetical protein WCT32_04480 [Patescibacteria group bacterium]|jgi:hypothetical protein